MQKQAIALAIPVAVKTAPVSIPEAPKIPGLTAKMYAIVINVVKPATTSVRTLVLFSESLNNFSNIFYLPSFHIT